MIAAGKALFKGKRQDVDMTEGNIFRHLIVFAIPLFIGNIFQQLYNMVDTWVVGNYVSDEAFSAVGTVGPIMNLLIGTFVGFSSGAGVVISQYYGAKRYDKVHDTVHTAIVMTLVLGVLFTALGIGMVPFMLDLMNTPDDVLPEATSYLTIYFSGILGLMIYNMGAGILRSVGDSRRPFYFLVVSAVTNTVLDLFFVLELDMGVAGVALATILAQGLSAVLIIITLMRAKNCVRLQITHLRLQKDMAVKIVTLGFPTALQMAVTSFSNIFVQSYINYFDKFAMGGWTAYSKIDQVVLLPMQSLALASTTFVGQNLGIRNEKRAKQGVRMALSVSIACVVVLIIPVMLFAPWLVSFFNREPKVVEYGTLFLRWLSPFYVLCCFNQIYAGALRGSGNTKTPTVIMLLSFVGFRQLYLFVMANYISNTVIPIALSYPAGWLLCSTLMMLYYKKTDLLKGRVVQDEQE
ncbi:MAG: MATE family efflux transporter [Lachnospiraceae bacterium]|nr:MATE family efflux transporter [Lachnospiraceae bacterium]